VELGASSRSVRKSLQAESSAKAAGNGKSKTETRGRHNSESSATSSEVDCARSPGLVDATQYDFERLERAVSELATSHDVLHRENATLREHLEERDGRLQRLEGELASADERRHQIAARLDALIEELDRLDAAYDASVDLSSTGSVSGPPGHSNDRLDLDIEPGER
jgi:chromosome segregation ATPase